MIASACSHKACEADLSHMSSAHSLRTDSTASTGGKPTPATIAEAPAVPNRHFRIDTGHFLAAAKPAECESAPTQEPAPTQNAVTSRRTDRDDETSYQQSWLHLHCVELIEKLQDWSADLDAREAQLNSRTALLEHRERQVRLEQQSSRLDLDELKHSLQQEIDELRAAARRLAFEL